MTYIITGAYEHIHDRHEFVTRMHSDTTSCTIPADLTVPEVIYEPPEELEASNIL